jgi:hypothetical protein
MNLHKVYDVTHIYFMIHFDPRKPLYVLYVKYVKWRDLDQNVMECQVP